MFINKLVVGGGKNERVCEKLLCAYLAYANCQGIKRRKQKRVYLYKWLLCNAQQYLNAILDEDRRGSQLYTFLYDKEKTKKNKIKKMDKKGEK